MITFYFFNKLYIQASSILIKINAYSVRKTIDYLIYRYIYDIFILQLENPGKVSSETLVYIDKRWPQAF